MTERTKRINELARLSKERELTADEKAEQARLREEYLAAFRKNLNSTLENTYIVDAKGNKQKIKKKTDGLH